MHTIKTLLGLEFKSKFGSSGLKDKKAVIRLVVSLAFFALVIYFLYAGAKLIFGMFDVAGMARQALTLIFTLLFILFCVMGVSNTIKVLYYKGDNLILMRFPVTDGEVFISKTLFLLISQTAITIGSVVPMLLAYGVTVGVDSFFYAMIPAVIFFLIAIPYFISNVLAIPFMHLTNRIRNRFGLIIAMLAVFIAGMFACYMLIFSSIVTFLNDSSLTIFSGEVVDMIKGMTYYFIPTKYFADLLLKQEVYFAMPALIGLTGALGAGTVAVITKMYSKTLLKNVEIEGSAFKKITVNKPRPVFVALLKKEFIQIFRSVNYSFQYFVLACAMPVMVYFCNDIVTAIAKQSVGEQAAMGISILVMLIFATVITSFSATSVTREGNNFYQTKVLPVPIRTQLLSKFVIYAIVSFSATLICVTALAIAGYISALNALWLFGITESLALAMTLRSMKYDIKKPNFNMVGEGELVSNNTNTGLAMGFGFLVAIVMGLTSIFAAYFLTQTYMYLICSGLAVLIIAYCLLTFFYKVTKRYNAIVHR
ncbi:MAG: hypothetical protein FWD49_00235 [Firmicutes bacterium]|nr:hypothetical protein [Bacillota bacterium]